MNPVIKGQSTILKTRDTVVGHLDKSHVTVHTYPEYHPDNSIATFRVDIEVSTCGEISPLNALGLFDWKLRFRYYYD